MSFTLKDDQIFEQDGKHISALRIPNQYFRLGLIVVASHCYPER